MIATALQDLTHYEINWAILFLISLTVSSILFICKKSFISLFNTSGGINLFSAAILISLISGLIFFQDILWYSSLFTKFLLFCLSVWVTYCAFKEKSLTPEYSKEEAGTQISFIRIVVCSILLIFVLKDNPLDSLLLPEELIRDRTGLHSVFSSIEFINIRNSTYLILLRIIAIISLISGLVGFKTRIALTIASLSYIMLYDVYISYTHIYHSGLLPLQMLLLMSIVPGADYYSLDRYLSQRINKATPNIDYRSFLFCLWILYSCAYFMAGMSKLMNKSSWINSDTLKAYILNDSLNLIQYDWNIATKIVDTLSDEVWFFIALFSVVIETAAILILFSSHNRRVLPIFIFCLHLGILALNEFMFLDLLILPLIFIKICSVSFKSGLKNINKRQLHNIFENRSSKKWMYFISILLPFMLSSILFNLNIFPVLDRWSMYSEPLHNTTICYQKLFVETQDSNNTTLSRSDLSEYVSFLSEARWLDIVGNYCEKDYMNLARIFKHIDKSLRKTDVKLAKITGFILQERLYEIKIDGKKSSSKLIKQVRFPVGSNVENGNSITKSDVLPYKVEFAQ